MTTFKTFGIRESYKKVSKLRTNLKDMNSLVDWISFRQYLPSENKGVGRHGYNNILKLKMLFLQGWYNISDEELEYQVNDRISFQAFLDFPESVPDFTTIWKFREEISEHIDDIWSELQRQLSLHKVNVEKGVVQDAKFITSNPGNPSGNVNRGREAKTSRSKEGSWTKKRNKTFFGHKLHIKSGIDDKIIREIAITSAHVHDNHIDLAKPDEIIFRDKAWTGTKTKAKGNATMKRGKLSIREKLRNKRISKKRCKGEHPFGSMVRSQNAGHTNLTTNCRVFIQQIFVCFAYNIARLKFLLAKAM